MQELKKVSVKVPQAYLDFINQIFEIEKKAANIEEDNSIQRNLNKIKGMLEEEFFRGNNLIGFTYHNPIGENYSDTRTDCEATIAGVDINNLEIIEVIKPIVFCAYQENDVVMKSIVQQAVVIVQSKNII